jgi:hypothetical protein
MVTKAHNSDHQKLSIYGANLEAQTRNMITMVVQNKKWIWNPKCAPKVSVVQSGLLGDPGCKIGYYPIFQLGVYKAPDGKRLMTVQTRKMY